MPDIRATVLRSEQADTYLDIGNLVDAAGNRFVAVGTFEFDPGARRNTNNTWVDVFQYTPTGVIAGVWRVLPQAGYKADAINLSRSGADLIVTVVTHAAVSDKPRGVHVETASIPGVFVTNPQFELEEGGAGAWQPTAQEVEVDYGQIRQIMVEEINRLVRPHVEFWAREAIGNIIPKTMHAFIQGLDENNTREPAPDFRAALFDYLKNAAANPLANVLGGLDEWGEDRRQELIATIREANGNG
jgi:hypothetical protein